MLQENGEIAEVMLDFNIAHESELPSRKPVSAILIECESLADQIAIEEFIVKLRGK